MLAIAIAAAVLALIAFAALWGAKLIVEGDDDSWLGFTAFLGLGAVGVGSGLTSLLMCLFVLMH
jgi:hypothetical protein